MKIVILGAGISGFSAYLFLKKHLESRGLWSKVSVVIYEAYDVGKLNANVTPLLFSSTDIGTEDGPAFTPVAVGSALGLGQNGLNVLRRLDRDGVMLEKVRSRGNPIDRWRMSNARGWTLADIRSASPSDTSGSSVQNEQLDSPDTSEMTLMIARQELWEVLCDETLRDDAGVVVKKKVHHVVIGNPMKKSKSVISFDDGTSDEADLVIGADGLRSTLRRAIFEHDEPGSQQQQQQQEQISNRLWTWLGMSSSDRSPGSKAKVDYITPHFEGLVSFGGFLPTEVLESKGEGGSQVDFDTDTMNFVFGPNGFFGYGCISSTPSTVHKAPQQSTERSASGKSVSAWWSTFSSPVPYPYRRQQQRSTEPMDLEPTSTSTNDTSNQKQPTDTFTFDDKTGLQDLLIRHSKWHNPAIQKILEYTRQTGLSSTNFYPTWTTPELPTWQKSGAAILIGDAAHALQTTSGQGASQALEDAEALALFLTHHLASVRDGGDENVDTTTASSTESATATAVATALEQFEGLRRPRVHAVHARAQKMADKKSSERMGLVQEMVMYFFIWLFSLFRDSFTEWLVEYDLPAEVGKVIESWTVETETEIDRKK